MKRTLLIIITAAALILAACQNTIRYEYDINDGKITLLGQLSSVDSVHSVFLSMSYPDRIDSLADATVSCYVNGERHLASKVHPGYQEQYDIITQEITMVPRKNRYTEYRFQAGFKPGDDVRIEASKGDMKAWVELEVPQPGKIDSVDTVTVVKKWSYQDIDGTDTYEQEYVEFTIRLKDAEGTDSYFTLDAVMAEVTKLFSGELITETLQSAGRLDYETFHDLVLEDGYSSGIGDMFEDLLPVNSTHCFSDKMFQDGETTVKLYVPTYCFTVYPNFYPDTDLVQVDKSFSLVLNSFDRSFYNYLRALNNMFCYGFDVNPIVEPTMLPNNVTGGMGMVSIAAGTSFEIVLPTVTYKPYEIIYY